jgi:ribosomal protein S8
MRQDGAGLNVTPAPKQESQMFKVSLGYKMPLLRNKQRNKKNKRISLRGSRIFKERREMPVACSISQVQMFSVGYVWWLMPLIPALGG